MMKDVLEVLIGVVILFPFIISVGLVLLFRKLTYVLSMKKIADYTTPFLFLSVYIIAHAVIGAGVGFIIAIIAVLLILFLAILERRGQKDFSVMNLLRKVWRLYFLILAVVYLVLIVIGIIQAIAGRMVL